FYAKDSPISIHVSLHEGRGKPSIVAISDPVPPAGDPAPWELNKLFGLIDQRYNAMLPVWMTANARSEKDLQERLTAQLYDRLRENALILPCFWPSHRGQNQAPAAKGTPTTETPMTTATINPPKRRTVRRRARRRSCTLCGRAAAFAGVITASPDQVTTFALCGPCGAQPDDVIFRRLAGW